MGPSDANYFVADERADILTPIRFLVNRAFGRFLRAHERSPQCVLDLGCGAGHYRRFLSVNGVQSNLDCGVDLLIESGWAGNRFLCANAQVLPFADNTFDLAYSITSFEHFDDPAVAGAELLRVLAPGSTAFISVPGRLSWVLEGGGHGWYYDEGRLRAVLPGLEILSVRSTGGVICLVLHCLVAWKDVIPLCYLVLCGLINTVRGKSANIGRERRGQVRRNFNAFFLRRAILRRVYNAVLAAICVVDGLIPSPKRFRLVVSAEVRKPNVSSLE